MNNANTITTSSSNTLSFVEMTEFRLCIDGGPAIVMTKDSIEVVDATGRHVSWLVQPMGNFDTNNADKDATIRACVECGQEIQNSCYHDGTDFTARTMTLNEALRIAEFFGNDEAVKKYQAMLRFNKR